MRKIFTSFFLLVVFIMHAQDSKITGKVLDDIGDGVQFANVIIKNTSTGTSTDEYGNYAIVGLSSGNYTVEVSFLGYTTYSYDVTLSTNETKTINVTLLKSKKQLQEVEIVGRKARTYKNNESYSGTKTATKIKDIPQAISYVTKEIFEDQQAYRVNDIVKNVSGVNQYSWYDDFSMRGFRSGETYINGLRVIGLFGPRPLLANIERVEVLKGPASAMFGNASPGGTMNRVRKNHFLRIENQ